MDKNEIEKFIEDLKKQMKMEDEFKKISQNPRYTVHFHKNTKVRYNINSSNTKPYDISKMTGKPDSQSKKEKEE